MTYLSGSSTLADRSDITLVSGRVDCSAAHFVLSRTLANLSELFFSFTLLTLGKVPFLPFLLPLLYKKC